MTEVVGNPQNRAALRGWSADTHGGIASPYNPPTFSIIIVDEMTLNRLCAYCGGNIEYSFNPADIDDQGRVQLHEAGFHTQDCKMVPLKLHFLNEHTDPPTN